MADIIKDLLVRYAIRENDICKRLRGWDMTYCTDNDALRRDRESREAANEIERLRAILKKHHIIHG